jgi:hypothetical protein
LHLGPGSLVVHNDTTDTLKATLNFSGSTARLVTDAATPLQLTTGANNGIYIGTNGNVGVGTTTAGSNLTVLGTATVSGQLGAESATVSGKLTLDSLTNQINATNNRSLQFGLMNTGRIEFLTSSNYFDNSGNLDISGIYKSGGSSGATVNSFACEHQ